MFTTQTGWRYAPSFYKKTVLMEIPAISRMFPTPIVSLPAFIFSEICRPFAKEGYCDKGADCLDKHVFECPDFDQKGVCNDKTCKLPHIEHAGRTAAKAAKQSDGNSDVSSDEEDDGEEDEEHFGSDDVDSDYFSDNEVILQTSDDGHEVSQQADFIQF
ncbi:hypothetical protein DRE_04797 [Drechslerella stenobrocha 248]|uniref:C3H1-type domain-containing protein n=1 Tax=Drechslerella stenobrocha 248 TaxID=1043628 RepID=W7HS62_9PEZI|nr:hypothetical protein DRE_04797 [Drechslerella stenobrocha 248]